MRGCQSSPLGVVLSESFFKNTPIAAVHRKTEDPPGKDNEV
jgi:hypothetical protein